MDTMKQHLLGLDFTDMTLAQAASWCLRRDRVLEFTYVVTPNADHLARLRRRPDLLPLYRQAELCLLDSRLLRNLATLLRQPAPPVVTGADLTEAVLRGLSARGGTVMVIGLEERQVEALRRRFDGLRFAHHNPPMKFAHDPRAMAEAVRFIRTYPTDIVLLAVGSPQQEILANALKHSREATGLGLCIGAAALFASGARKRAPLWMQRAGFEWAPRLAYDPRRMARRYLLDDPPILAALARQAVRSTRRPADLRARQDQGTLSPETPAKGDALGTR
jgi:N-acetylglucosaminyldiphosphoundecaprenol N-acetyl-beta-D-mannosaminyltransferase